MKSTLELTCNVQIRYLFIGGGGYVLGSWEPPPLWPSIIWKSTEHFKKIGRCTCSRIFEVSFFKNLMVFRKFNGFLPVFNSSTTKNSPPHDPLPKKIGKNVWNSKNLILPIYYYFEIQIILTENSLFKNWWIHQIKLYRNTAILF